VAKGVASFSKTLPLINRPTNFQPFTKETQPVEPEVNIKDYHTLLDEYSLHYFVIRNGEIVPTEEWSSYQRTYYQHWGRIDAVVRKMK